VKFYVEDELSGAGAIIDNSQKPSQSHAIRDRELITAQNPMSDQRFTELFIETLSEQQTKGGKK